MGGPWCHRYAELIHVQHQYNARVRQHAMTILMPVHMMTVHHNNAIPLQFIEYGI